MMLRTDLLAALQRPPDPPVPAPFEAAALGLTRLGHHLSGSAVLCLQTPPSTELIRLHHNPQIARLPFIRARSTSPNKTGINRASCRSHTSSTPGHLSPNNHLPACLPPLPSRLLVASRHAGAINISPLLSHPLGGVQQSRTPPPSIKFPYR